MRLNPERDQDCRAAAITHLGGNGFTAVTLICGPGRVAQIPTGLPEIVVWEGQPTDSMAAYQAGRIATEALVGFCVNCPNRTSQETNEGGQLIAFPSPEQ